MAVSLRRLISSFESEFHADAEQAATSIAAGLPFNLLHRSSYLKVGFFPADSAFNREAIKRADSIVLGTGGPAIRVATCEDILLAKLRLGKESPDQQRRDIMGIVALNCDLLDRTYLGRCAAELGVIDLLERFLGSIAE